MSSIGREFCSVFLQDKNVTSMVVAEGWAKVLVFHFHLKFNFCTYCSLQLLISFLGTMDICYVDFLDK